MPPDHNRISIIIPTYNGASRILDCLNSIKKQTQGNTEIIVVVDGSKDNTEEILKPFNSSLKILFQSNKGRAVTRNNGFKAASEEIIFFVDDDMRLTENTLESHLKHQLDHPDSILVGKVKMDQSKIKTGFTQYIDTLYEKWDTSYREKSIVTERNLKFTTQHVSMPRQIFERLGGFDSRLTDGEDYDFAMRALQAKIKIFYDPQIIAYHDDFPNCEKYIKRQVEYKLSHQKLASLEKEYQSDLFPVIKKPSSFRCIISRFFTSKKWVSWVDEERLSYLPNKLKFRIYSEIIYAHTLKGLGLL